MSTALPIAVPVNIPGTPFNRAIKDAKFIRKELLVIIKERKVELLLDQKKEYYSTTRDLLSRLLLTPDENGKFMSEVEIADRIIALLIGGFDTTTSTITTIISYLAQLPHVYDQVFKEQMKIAESKGPKELLNWEDIQKMKYSWNVACEAMRLAPPSQVAFKEALIDFTYAGFKIPKGWKACWGVNSTHKNPMYFPDPEKFDPSRFEGNGPAPYTFVPFGGGPRMCPGKEYARLVILVFVHNLVRKFNWERLIPNEKITFKPFPTPVNGLPVSLQPN